MKTKIVALGSASQNHKALDFFTKMGLLDHMTVKAVNTADSLRLVGNNRVLVIGAGFDPNVLLAYAASGAKVDLAQPSEAKIAKNIIQQNDMLQKTLRSIMSESKMKGLDAELGEIDTTSFVGYIQNVGLPKGAFSVAVLPNVFDIQVDSQKSFFI
ncbi:MAG: hypothetical protein WCH76_03445, partial [Candidatus Riflemargulisbacteria bacterium]